MRNMILHIISQSLLSISRVRIIYIVKVYFLFGLLSFILPNYKKKVPLNKSSLLSGQCFGKLSSCQVVTGTDLTLVPVSSAKHDGPVCALCCNLPPLRVNSSEFEYMLDVIVLLWFTLKDKIPPCCPRVKDFFLWASDGWLALFLSL